MICDETKETADRGGENNQLIITADEVERIFRRANETPKKIYTITPADAVFQARFVTKDRWGDIVKDRSAYSDRYGVFPLCEFHGFPAIRKENPTLMRLAEKEEAARIEAERREEIKTRADLIAWNKTFPPA